MLRVPHMRSCFAVTSCSAVSVNTFESLLCCSGRLNIAYLYTSTLRASFSHFLRSWIGSHMRFECKLPTNWLTVWMESLRATTIAHGIDQLFWFGFRCLCVPRRRRGGHRRSLATEVINCLEMRATRRPYTSHVALSWTLLPGIPVKCIWLVDKVQTNLECC